MGHFCGRHLSRVRARGEHPLTVTTVAASMREPSSSDPSPSIKIGGDQFRFWMEGEAIGRRGERDAVPVERPAWSPPPGGSCCAATSRWVGSTLGATGLDLSQD